MDGFYSSNQLPAQELQRQLSQHHHDMQQEQQRHHQQQHEQLEQQQQHEQQQQQQRQQQQLRQMSQNMASGQSMMTGDSLDEVIRNNQSELLRRRSMPQTYGNSINASNDSRRMSSMDTADAMSFGSGNNHLGGYQFNQHMSSPFPNLDTTNLNMSAQMNTYMTDQMGNYMSNPNDYSSMSPSMMGNIMAPDFNNMNMGQIPNDSSSMAMFSSNQTGHDPMNYDQYSSNQLASMGNEFSMELKPRDTSLSATPSNTTGDMRTMDGGDDDLMNAPAQPFNSMDNTSTSTSTCPSATATATAASASPAEPAVDLDTNMGNSNQGPTASLSGPVSSSVSVLSPTRDTSSTSITQPSPSSNGTTPATAPTPREPKDTAIYSKSGFDMLKALWLVATRKDPKIHLGAVDMSCAFVVCDVTMNDCPIIYVSDNFQNLTGYSRHEIVGQNCRFLQAPDAKVEAGSKREFVDDGAVYNLKKKIQERREVQQSLINYRKGGKPFLNLLTMIPIPWDTDEIRYFIGFQIDLVECPDAIASGLELGGVKVNYKHSDIGQYIWTPPASSQWEPENGQTLGMDDVSTLLQQFNPKGIVSDWHKQSWDKMLLENTDDVVHVLSLKGLFLYTSPSCKRVLEYDPADVIGNSLSSVCHPSDIVPVTRELKDTTAGNEVNIVFRIRRKHSGYTWFESHGSLFVEQGKGRKCIILVGRKRPVFALSRRSLEANSGIGDSEMWTKLSTSGMFLFVSSNVRSLLDLQPESLVGTSIQDLMRKESRADFGRSIEAARRGNISSCKHEVQNRRGQGLQAQTTLYPGDASEGQKPSFLLAQTKLLKASSRSIAPASVAGSTKSGSVPATPMSDSQAQSSNQTPGQVSQPAGGALALGSQDAALASDDNVFDELRTTKCSSWQFELRQMEKVNRILAEELGGLLSNKKKRKRRKGVGNLVRDCANCHTRNTPEWRRGPSGQRDLCNSCGLRWAKQTGRVSPRNSSRGGNNGNGDSQSKKSVSPGQSPLHREVPSETPKPHSAADSGREAINPAQLTNNDENIATVAMGDAALATDSKSSLLMPPPSQPSLSGGVAGSSMTSIREERENSQP